MPGRDNGFVARHYIPLADLDPRMAEAMLDALRRESIAAYVEPSHGEIGGYLDVHLPERPYDRLWVDRERHDRAAVLLEEHLGPGRPGAAAPVEPSAAADEAWTQLIAGFDLPTDDIVPRWPVAEDVLAEPAPPDRSTSPLRNAPSGESEPSSAVPRRIVRRAESGPGGTADADPPVTTSGEFDPLSVLDEHFVPPVPPPGPRLRLTTRWALAAIVAGLGLLVVHRFTGVFPEGTVTVGILAIVAGFATLVYGMAAERPDDHDSDDGAVV